MIKPLFNNILIKPVEKEKITGSGFIIPDSVKDRPQLGEVIAIGNVENIKVGDSVYYKAWAGNEVKDNDIEYLIIEDKDVVAKDE